MNESTIAFIGIFLILAVIFFPMITIWALNTLFGLQIPTTFATWFATLWLTGIVAAKANFNPSGK